MPRSSILIAIFCVLVCREVWAATEIIYDLAEPGKPLNRDLLAGTCLPVWNQPGLYKQIQKGMAASNYRLFRFPNGSLSNNYHWNGNGAYDENGIWTVDETGYKPGFQSEILYRGTSKSHYGSDRASAITDGDTATFWWSDEYVQESSPRFYLDLIMAQDVDSVRVLFGKQYGVDFDIQAWRTANFDYPGPHQSSTDEWITLDSVRGNSQNIYETPVAPAGKVRYIRVIVHRASGGGKSVQVRECFLLHGGKPVSRHSKTYSLSTKVTALSTHIGSKLDWIPKWDFEAFMKFVKGYPGGAESVICINYSTGTPEEAAAWVRYANIAKSYGIKYWQVGNEMDGEWEEGGPVTAYMYAERYLQFAKAMKAVDPGIKVFGPVLANFNFTRKNSGNFNGKNWMEAFIEYVGAHEKTDGKKYLDGVDFHAYPYFFSALPSVYGMQKKINAVAVNTPHLKSFIHTHLLSPDSVYVFLSEYNSAVVMSDLLHRPVNALFLANILAGLAEQFGDRAMAVVWDSYEGGGTGPNKTHGSLSLFNAATGGLWSTFRKPPSAAYWGLYSILNLFIPPGKSAAILNGDQNRTGMVQSYGVKTASDFRSLLLNFELDSQAVALKGIAGFPSAEIYTWSEREFGWNGTTDKAYASPNCGPSSKRIPAGSLDSFSLPPLSITVIRFHGPGEKPAGLETLHFGSNGRMLEPGDTLLLFGTYANPGGVVTAFSWSKDSGKTWLPAPALDNTLDGPMENTLLALPAATLLTGTSLILLRAQSAGFQVTDSLKVNVLGKVVPSLLIDDFEDGDMITSLKSGTKWGFFAQGKNNSQVTPAIVTGDPSAHLSAAFDIIQPADLGYANYIQIFFKLDTADMSQLFGTLGLKFDYATSRQGPGGKFELLVQSVDVKDYDHFTVQLENTGGLWRTARFRWDELRQSGWGEPVGPLTAKKIRGIQFRALGEGKGAFRLDNLFFLARAGSSIEEKPKPGRGGNWALKYIRRISHNSVEIATNSSDLEKAVLYNMSGKKVPLYSMTGESGNIILTWPKNAFSGFLLLELTLDGRKRWAKLNSAEFRISDY